MANSKIAALRELGRYGIQTLYANNEPARYVLRPKGFDVIILGIEVGGATSPEDARRFMNAVRYLVRDGLPVPRKKRKKK